MRHDGADDNRHKHACEDEKATEIADVGQESVHEENNTAAHPGTDDEADENMPRLRDKAWVHERIHGDGLLAQDRGHGRCAEDPGKEVPESSEKTAYTAIFPGGDGGPVIDWSVVSVVGSVK